MLIPDPSAPRKEPVTQASEEARPLERLAKLLSDANAELLITLSQREWKALLAEHSREALERAVKAIEEPANSLREWMERLPLNSPERMDKSLRAGELYMAARLVRRLIPGEK